jgi:acetyl esterase/lipase
MKIFLALFVFAVGGASIGAAQTFAYTSNPNGPELDVYGIEGAENAPIMIYVHGGAWMIGDKRQVRDKPAFFNANGYVFISVNYTLVPRGTVEEQFSEIDAAIGYVADNAARFGGDAGNISLMGHSAGAHLVTMAAVKPGPQVRGLLAQGALRAVIANDTIAYDIARIAEGAGGRLPRLYRRPFSEDPARWALLSPVSYVAEAQNLPRFMLTHSAQGNAAARAQGVREFAEALQSVGANVRVFDGRAYNHMQISRAVGVEADISGAIIEFLRAQ